MDTKKAFKAFKYRTEVRWTSGRRGEASAAGLPNLGISSPAEFKGEPGSWTARGGPSLCLSTVEMPEWPSGFWAFASPIPRSFP